MKYLVDTNVLVRFFRGEEKVIEKLDQVISKGLGVSCISLAELYHGAEKSMKTKRGIKDINRLLEAPKVEVIKFADKEAREFGKLMNELEMKGNKLDSMDVLIAATAKIHKLVILTSDKRHFTRLDKFGVKVELV